MGEFRMPSLGADMTAGTLIGWMKKPGDVVKRGDIIAEVDTDKGVIEVEVFEDGVIEKLLVHDGEKVPVGTALAVINGSHPSVAPSPGRPPVETGSIVEQQPSSTNGPQQQRRIHASPVARKLSSELGVDLAKVKGTGPGGRIQREDVEAAAKQSRPPMPEPAADDRYARMRHAIAAAMATSKREIPHYYLGTTIDMTRALDWLDAENANRPIKERILYSVMLLKSVALALRDVPELNAKWENGAVQLMPTINVGNAISLRQGGLVAPALKETDKRSLDELMRDLRDLVQRTRAGKLRSSDLSESTITVTNIGEQSVETVYGVIYPPQVALVGFGSVYEDVSVKDGGIRACRRINATLSADHRVSDGHRGGLFLAAVNRLLQEPERL